MQFDESCTSVMALVARVVEFTVGAMAFVEQDDVDIELLLNRRAAPAVVDEAKARMLEAILAARIGVPVGRVRARLFAPPGSGHSAEETTLDAFASFPVQTNDRLAGMLVLTGRAVGKITPETRAFLAQVANQAHIVLENSRLFERVRNLAIRDSLTDLFNHRHHGSRQHEFERVGGIRTPSASSWSTPTTSSTSTTSTATAGDAVLREWPAPARHPRTTDAPALRGRVRGRAAPHGAEEARRPRSACATRSSSGVSRRGRARSASVSGAATCPARARFGGSRARGRTGAV